MHLSRDHIHRIRIQANLHSDPILDIRIQGLRISMQAMHMPIQLLEFQSNDSHLNYSVEITKVVQFRCCYADVGVRREFLVACTPQHHCMP